MSHEVGPNILDALDEDEDSQVLEESCKRLHSSDAKEQLSAALKISEVLQTQIAAYPLDTELPGLPESQARRVDALRKVWVSAFGDNTPVDQSASSSDELDDNTLKTALDLGKVSLDGVVAIIQALRAAGALPSDASLALCDLRAGGGQLLAAAALLHPFARVAGLEPEPEKVEEAHAAFERLRAIESQQGTTLCTFDAPRGRASGLSSLILEERDIILEEERRPGPRFRRPVCNIIWG